MTSKLGIGALRALCAISDRGGVSRTAAALTLSYSAVSHTIKRLELSLGYHLLDRSAAQPLLTREGEELLRYARRILMLHDEAVSSLSTQSVSGRVRLGVTEDTTSREVTRVMGRFKRLQPALEIEIRVAQSRVIGQRLDRGELDVGIMQVFAAERQADDITLGSILCIG